MELKILNWLISFLQKLKKSLSNGIDELVYMKYVVEFGERDDDIYVSTFELYVSKIKIHTPEWKSH
jgi:hypothetical protein